MIQKTRKFIKPTISNRQSKRKTIITYLLTYLLTYYMSRRGKSLFLEVPGQVEMSSNGKSKPLESKICVLGCAGVGKSGKTVL